LSFLLVLEAENWVELFLASTGSKTGAANIIYRKKEDEHKNSKNGTQGSRKCKEY
jgi:hypothetical protein